MDKNVYSKNFEAYKAIKQLIFEQQLVPGQKLIYRDLEEKLGMSKTPIINGLMMLEKENVVISKRNRGFYICDVSRQEALKVFDLRTRLEEITVEYAIANMDNNDIPLLREKLIAYKRYKAEFYDLKRFLLDKDFHVQIAIMSKNNLLVRIMEQFYESIYFMLKSVFLSHVIEKFKKEHDMLFEAIKNRKVQEAKKTVRNHGLISKDLIEKMTKY